MKSGSMVKLMRRCLTAPAILLECLSIAAFLLLLGIITLEVVLRSTIGHSLEMTEELAIYFLIAIIFFSAARMLVQDKFLRVDLIYRSLKGRVRFLADIVFGVMVVIISWIYFSQTLVLFLSSYRRGGVSTGVVEVPFYIPQSIILIGTFALLIASLLVVLRTVFRALKAINS